MKTFSVVLLCVLLPNAHAAWKTMKCSNADGTVKWQQGFEDNFVKLKYSNFIEGTLTLGADDISVQFSKEVTLKEKSFKNCSEEGRAKVFASQVKITASDKNPEVLRSHFPQNRVQTEVICSTVETEDTTCTESN